MTTEIIPSGILNTKKSDYGNTPLFLGEQPGVFDTIHRQYPRLDELFKNMKSLDWDENEWDYSESIDDFKHQPKHISDMMIETFTFQWDLDTFAGRISTIVGLFNPCSELWRLWQRIGDNECVTGDHEVLTPKGWKRIDHVTLDDKVAQWDYDTKVITFVNPTNIITKEHKGPMYIFKDNNRNVSQVTTPKHRMPVIYPYTTAMSPPAFREAEEVNYHGNNGLPTAGYILAGGRRMSPRERLYVAVQADGSLCSDRYTGGYTGRLHYRFSFSKGRKVERLLSLCHAARWDVTELNLTTREEGYRTFIVHVPLEEYNAQAKTFDWFDLDQISYEWAVDFIDEIKHWDGNITNNGRTRYISNNKECVDKVVAVCHLIGMRGHITTLPARTGVLMPDGHLSDTKEVYQVYISPRDFVTGNSIVKSTIDFEGVVYCLEVPTSYFMIRHNGAVTITGNCTHACTYSEIARNAFENPREVLETVLNNQEAFTRMAVVGREMEKIRRRGLEFQLGLVPNDQETFNAAFMFTYMMLVLERVQFMSSFAVTFAIGEMGIFNPVVNSIKRICTDEWELHVETDWVVLKELMTTTEGQTAYAQCKDLMQEVLDEVVEAERAWTKHIFRHGQRLPKLDVEGLLKWVDYSATAVAIPLGLTVSNELKVNPLPYMVDWINISDTQQSPQEETSAQYKQNNLTRDDSEADFSAFDGF